MLGGVTMMYTLRTATLVEAGSSIPLDSGCHRHRDGSGIIKLDRGRHLVLVSAVVTGVATAIELGVYMDGELIPGTIMSVVPYGDTQVWTVNTAVEVYADCCDSISVRVITGDTVTVNSANVIVRKG